LGVILTACALVTAHGVFGATVFTTSNTNLLTSEEGKVALQWSRSESAPETNVEFQLQQSDTAGFSDPKTLYEGPDRGTVVTGLPEGEYFYRVRAVERARSNSPWSGTLTVKVQYPDRKTVAALMILGMGVFIGTVTAIVVGHRRAGSKGQGRGT